MPLICITSPKGGVGKTTLAANLAAELASYGHTVIGLDLDPQSALGLHFGLDPRDDSGFVAALRRGSDPSEAWRSALVRTATGVSLLPHGRIGMENAVAASLALAMAPGMLAEPVHDILSQPDVVVIADMPPGPSAPLAALLPLTDLLVTVLLTDATSLALIPSIETGHAYGRITSEVLTRERMVFVLNQWDNRTRLGRAAGEAARRHFGGRLLGAIYRDENVAEAVAAQRLLRDYAPESKAALDIANLADLIDRRLFPQDEPADVAEGELRR